VLQELGYADERSLINLIRLIFYISCSFPCGNVLEAHGTALLQMLSMSRLVHGTSDL
jgi:hypothetical protein